MAGSGKRLKSAYESFDKEADHQVDQAIKLLLGSKKTKFDETVEIAMNLGIDPRHADQMVRGVVSLPNGTGKTVRVAVFAKEHKAEEARAAEAPTPARPSPPEKQRCRCRSGYGASCEGA